MWSRTTLWQYPSILLANFFVFRLDSLIPFLLNPVAESIGFTNCGFYFKSGLVPSFQGNFKQKILRF
jgi:hypothetical protein